MGKILGKREFDTGVPPRPERQMSRYCRHTQISGVFSHIVVYMLHLWLDFTRKYRCGPIYDTNTTPITLPTQPASQSGKASPSTRFVNTPPASKPVNTPPTKEFFNTPPASEYEKTPPASKAFTPPSSKPVHPTQTAGQAVNTIPASRAVTPPASRAAIPPASRTVSPLEGSYENPISVDEEDLPPALHRLLDYGFSVTRIWGI